MKILSGPRWLLFFLFIITFLGSNAQGVTKFSGDSTRFVGELNTYFSTLSDNDRKIVEQGMVTFVQDWNAEKYDPAKKRIIYDICNQLLKKRVRPFPDFFSYISALNAFTNSRQPEQSFYKWSEILKGMADSKNSRNLLAFLDQTSKLFSDNILYQSSSATWRLTTPKYTFGKDTVPFIVFEKSDLICTSNRDSLTIFNTEGTYYPLSMQWLGNGGRVDWRRAGLDPGQVWADLGRYRIQIRFSKFMADSVEFINKKYFKAPLLGSFSDKVQADVTEEKASYPRFTSYERYIGIQNIFNDVDFFGGFSMEGAKVIGIGSSKWDAQLIFKKNGKEFIIARSKNFVIRPDRINSGSASVTLLHEEDSIYHTGVQLKYIDEVKELSLSKDERMSVLSPWYDSWHNIEIYCEALYWKMSDPQLSFEVMRGPGALGKAVFESENYYTLGKYEKLQGMDEMNPLNIIKSYTDKRKTREFTLDEMVKFMQKPPDEVESQLLILSARGFLLYDMDDKTAVVKQKLINYVDARNGRRDYDVIYYNSDVEGKSNALLNLETFDLKLEGVAKVALSDSQQVYIYPKTQEILMKKDQDFTFSGKIEAGLFDIYAKDCSFEYNKFRINLPAIDSVEFYTKGNQPDPKSGVFPMVKVKSSLNDLSGYLLIDDPGNKSGLKLLPEYPVFTNKDTAYVNWDKNYVFNGAYDKEAFYYKVLPFTLKSLDYMNPDTLKFKGSLTSAGIFPAISQPLQIMPDYSLGFVTETPATGYPVYRGKGMYYSNIELSNKGLHGNGKLTYLNSTSVSPDFLFFPDSMYAVAKSFVAAEQMAAVEYPAVVADSVKEYWLPYHDSLSVSTLKNDMAMYNNQSLFSGGIGLTPSGMNGNGTIRIKDSEMDSKSFSFRQHTFDALIANFRIKSYDLAVLSISTKNYRAHFDFDARKGEFKSNLGISMIEFPFNRYICSMDRFDWLIDNEEITLMNEVETGANNNENLSLAELIDVGYKGSEFISVLPSQDSLRFFAQTAKYNLKTNVINAEDVRIIKVADAAIFPDSGKVCIMKDAQIQVLHNANIIANTSNKFHSFYKADVSIATRHRYTGKGLYDYTDRNGEKQSVMFDMIRVDTAGTTIADGSITDSTHFRLSPEFGFMGQVSLMATEKNLMFDGGYKPITDCFEQPPDWVKFSSRVDPASVMLPVAEEPRNLKSERLTVGLVMSNTKGQIYPAFFEPKTSFSDSVILQSAGLVDYKPESGEFRVAPADLMKTGVAAGPAISLNTTSCLMRADGKLNLGLNSGNMKMGVYGTINHYVIPDSTNARIAISLDFPFLADALDKFRTQLMSINLPGVTLFSTPYATALGSLVNKDDAGKLKTEIEQFGRFRKFPDELISTLFIADVKMKWDTVSKAWVSYGNIGIGNIRNEMVNRYAEGKIEFVKKRNGDEFTIYLQLTKDDWYFFNYRNNIMQVISSNLEFNDLIIQAQQNKSEMNRIDKEAKGYRYTISTERKKRDFLRRFDVQEE
jgi:hypothetical protein